MARVGQGDILVVVRIDRLARSLVHLLEIVELLKEKGAYFRSVNDPIDTSSPQGMLMTQMLGVFAEFERALISERTKAGIKAAMARGAQPGNPKMRLRDQTAIDILRAIHKDRYLHELIDGHRRWMPTVERLRPYYSWDIVLRQIKTIKPPVRSFTTRTLTKACRAFIDAGYANPDILGVAIRLPPDDRVPRLLADRLRVYPDASLRELARWLSKDLREPTPRGSMTWSAEGVRRAIQRARALHLMVDATTSDNAHG